MEELATMGSQIKTIGKMAYSQHKRFNYNAHVKLESDTETHMQITDKNTGIMAYNTEFLWHLIL